jgi:iron-sulfur cluster repair protein YtfE (RIC family)
MTTGLAIDPSWTINDVIAKYPDTISVFNSFGLDLCCGADEMLSAAAKESQIDIEVLMSALLEVADKSDKSK